jgi:hypothetical protein
VIHQFAYSEKAGKFEQQVSIHMSSERLKSTFIHLHKSGLDPHITNIEKHALELIHLCLSNGKKTSSLIENTSSKLLVCAESISGEKDQSGSYEQTIPLDLHYIKENRKKKNSYQYRRFQRSCSAMEYFGYHK